MKDIKNYEGQYAITEDGQVWSYKNNKFISQHDNKSGYMDVQLCKNGKRKHYYAHRLVAQAYIPNPDNLPQVNHKDENTKNNHVSNLEWVTCDENNSYGTRKTRHDKAVSKPVYCAELDKTFKSITEAASFLKVSPGYISYALTHPNKSKGYHLNYLLDSNSSTTKALSNNR